MKKNTRKANRKYRAVPRPASALLRLEALEPRSLLSDDLCVNAAAMNE